MDAAVLFKIGVQYILGLVPGHPDVLAEERSPEMP
jgi:hypothetical protein